MRRLTLVTICIGLLFLLSVAGTVHAQDNPRDRLDRLRAELDSLSSVLNRYTQSEKDLGGRISALDQQIVTRRRLIRELESQHRSEQAALKKYDVRIATNRNKLGDVRIRLAGTTKEVAGLEALIARRAVFLYKKGGSESLRFLLAAENPGDFVRRRIYVERIADRDRRNLEALRDARQRQSTTQRELETTLADLQEAREQKAASLQRIERLVKETRSERSKLEKDKGHLNVLLADLRKDKQGVLDRIEDRKAAMKQVEDWIASLERERARGGVQEIKVSRRPGDIVIRPVKAYPSFSDARGHLPWPVRGTVVSRFGQERNKITNTITENPGIEIQAHEGDEVLAVQGGICTRITYLRGFGTTVLIDHGDGYYTVYAHFGDVWVSEGEKIEPGRVLGTVGNGEGGSPTLQFQVWHKRQKEDPLRWLTR